MKKTYLVLLAFVLTATVARATSSFPVSSTFSYGSSSSSLSASNYVAMAPRLSLASAGDFTVGSILRTPRNLPNFADLDNSSTTMPFPVGVTLAVIALAVLAFRVYGLSHARGMADTERDTHLAKAQMYRSLHES